MIDFPQNPTTGQEFTPAIPGNTTWVWDGQKWISLGSGTAQYLPLTGGTMTGPINLAGDPVAPLQATTKEYVDDNYLPLVGGALSGPLTLAADPIIALGAATRQYADSKLPLAGGTLSGPLILAANPTVALGSVPKQYVDALPIAMNDNIVINGDMAIDQRHVGALGTAVNVITVDRFWYVATQAAKGTWGQNLNASTTPIGFSYCLGFQSSSAYALLAADNFRFSTRFEGYSISYLAWGTTAAQPVTLSFWALSNVTGLFSGAIRNFAATRSYPFTYTIPTANTWLKFIITIPGDTTGTWINTSSAGALSLDFDLGSGTTLSGPANAWASANYIAANGSINIVSTNGAYFYITGIKLEAGNIATPFNRQSTAKRLADCQRYYQQGIVVGVGYSQGGNNIAEFYTFPVVMRVAPSMILNNDAGNNVGAGYISPYVNGFNVGHPITITGQANFTDSFTASADI
jgi:hypothetical protein